jgi:hypothetical protein
VPLDHFQQKGCPGWDSPCLFVFRPAKPVHRRLPRRGETSPRTSSWAWHILSISAKKSIHKPSQILRIALSLYAAMGFVKSESLQA